MAATGVEIAALIFSAIGGGGLVKLVGSREARAKALLDEREQDAKIDRELYDRLIATIDRSDKRAEEAEGALGRANNDRNIAFKEIQKLEGKVDNLQNQVEALTAQVNKLSSELERREDENSALKMENFQLKMNEERCKRREADLEFLLEGRNPPTRPPGLKVSEKTAIDIDDPKLDR